MNGLTVALGDVTYRVERPWGEVPAGQGVPSDVAVTRDGRVLVLLRRDPTVDPAWPAVIVLSPEGRRLAAWGEEILDGHFLAAHPDGRVFVVDRDMHEVVVFDADGRRIGGLGMRGVPGAPFNAPCDVAFGADGTVYVADGYGNSLVHRFDASGTLVGSWGRPGAGPGEFTTPHSIAVLPDGRVAVADRENNRVQVFTPDGRFLASWSDHHKPMSLSVDGAGRLWVTDQVPRLSVLSGEGALVGRCRPVLNGAHGMALAADGTVVLSEQNPPRVTRLVPVA
jgi:DNA-binding beta-propeller fold protein YncE